MAKDGRSRRANGEGTDPRLRKDGRYEIKYTVQTPRGPKRRSVYGSNPTECRANFREAVRASGSGFAFEAGKLTLGEFMREWLDSLRGTVREVTWIDYDAAFRNHIEPDLGHVKLAKLTPLHVRSWMATKRAENTSPVPVRKALALLKRALSQAVAWDLAQRNAAEGAKPPRYVPKKKKPLSLADVRRFFEAVKGDPFEALFVVAVTTGFREAELLALRYDDLDLEAGRLRVDEGVVVLPGGVEDFNEPKSKSGERSVPLTAPAIAALREHRRRFQERRIRSGQRGDIGRELVFPSPRGGVYRAPSLRLRLYKLLGAAGLPKTTVHELRHTAASLLAVGGTPPRTAKEILGHAKIATTMEIYTHLPPEMAKKAVANMDRMLKGGEI